MVWDIPGFENVGIGKVRLIDGLYTVNVQQPPTQEHKNDKVSIKLVMKVVAGPNQVEPQDETGTTNPAGRDLTDYLPMHPNALWRLKRLCVAAGVIARDDKASDVARGKIDPDRFVGSTFQIKLRNAEWEGKAKYEIDYVC